MAIPCLLFAGACDADAPSGGGAGAPGDAGGVLESGGGGASGGSRSADGGTGPDASDGEGGVDGGGGASGGGGSGNGGAGPEAGGGSGSAPGAGGSMAPPSDCIEGEMAPGTTACGFNGRGLIERECVSGTWQDSLECIDPDECEDDATEAGTTPCGLNGRGALDVLCVDGTWQDSLECIDPDECVDGASGVGTTPCGAGARGQLEHECQIGSWVDAQTCIVHDNVLLIIADDVGAESSSLYPQAASGVVATMPTIAGLAAQGLVFDRAWASPVCSPTRASILTGLYGNRTDVLTVADELDSDIPTIFEQVGATPGVDYGTAVFGKWHLAGTSANNNQAAYLGHVLGAGVETFAGFIGGGISDYFAWDLLTTSGSLTAQAEYATTVITDQVIDYITEREIEHPTEPWFAYVAYSAPHSPFQVPPADLHGVDLGGLEPGDIAVSIPVYQAMLEALDTEIGRLLEVVDLSETTVIYLGDNGTPAEVKASTSQVRGSKISTYEGGIWVPFVVAGAAVTRVGEREDDLVVVSDLYATVLGLSGTSVDQVGDSYSLIPLLTDASSSTGRTHAFTEHCSPFFGNHVAIRGERYKLLRTSGTWGLFDLLVDPGEQNNLYFQAAYSGIRQGLQAELGEIESRAVTGCF